MKDWLKKRPCLSLRCMEREAGLPIKTLDHYVSGRRELNEQHQQKLKPVLERYGWADQKL